MRSLSNHPALDIVSKVAGKINNILRFYKTIGYEEMRFLTLHASYDPTFVEDWITAIEEKEVLGEGGYDPDFFAEWRASMQQQFALKLSAYGKDPDQFMALYAEYFRDKPSSYYAHNPHWLVRQLVRAGRFAIVEGDLDMGKTDFSCHLYDLWHDLWEEHQEKQKGSDLTRIWGEVSPDEDGPTGTGLGLIYAKRAKLVANITIYPDSILASEYQFAPSLAQAMIYISQNALAGEMSLFVLDEAGLNWIRKRSTSQRSVAIESIFRLVRKFNCAVVLITQNADLDLPEAIRRPDRGAKTVITKLKQKEAEVFVDGAENFEHVRVGDIPRTRIKFETKGLAGMAVEFDPQDLSDVIEARSAQIKQSKGRFTPEDMYREVIVYCGQKMAEYKVRKELEAARALAAPTAHDPALQAQVRLMRQRPNQDTGEPWEISEMAEECMVTTETIVQVMDLLDAAQARRPPPAPTPTRGVRGRRKPKVVEPELPTPEVAAPTIAEANVQEPPAVPAEPLPSYPPDEPAAADQPEDFAPPPPA
jgi:hypothetical protein